MDSKLKKRFESEYREYVDVIYRLCLFKLNNSDHAYDVTQDVFTKYFVYLEKKGSPKSPKSFLYQIARNQIIDYYRKKKTESLDVLQENGFEPEEQRHGETYIERQSEYNIVYKTLMSLDEHYRDVLYLRLIEENSISEIAELLNISPNNVSVRINRGKKKLQEVLL